MLSRVAAASVLFVGCHRDAPPAASAPPAVDERSAAAEVPLPPPTRFAATTDDQPRLLASAREALGRGDADTAITALLALRETASASEPKAIGMLILAQLYHSRGNLDASLEVLEWLRASTPGSGELEFVLGNTLLDAGRRPEAESALQRAIRVDPSYLRAYPTLAALQLELGREGDADTTLVDLERAALRMGRELDGDASDDEKLRLLQNLRIGFPHPYVSQAAVRALDDESAAVVLAALETLRHCGTADALPQLDALAASSRAGASEAAGVASAIRAR
ncbi:MAG: tetratricopeptide repeat protein [Myxococcales bacterium]|nr:tetratricopeptide repeat protein [Myxococcales bacterium]MCB9519609.1 tetratricopeptide repeat protein [Myxococcales bacterium]MCB9530664.1 tetratricopeptide repeat protein [Myxococcales bacterium]